MKFQYGMFYTIQYQGHFQIFERRTDIEPVTKGQLCFFQAVVL